MPIDLTKRLVHMGVEAAHSLPDRVITAGHVRDSDLYILMQGFAGAFYSIWESLYSVQHDDPVFKAVLDNMLKAGFKKEYDGLAGKVRIALSHKALTVTSNPITDWEVDEINDTIEPVYSHEFATITSPTGSRNVSFNEWAKIIMDWWGGKMVEIERDYNRAKGQSI
jgi:hypothetical protein